jgi:hypothetical protein
MIVDKVVMLYLHEGDETSVELTAPKYVAGAVNTGSTTLISLNAF